MIKNQCGKLKKIQDFCPRAIESCHLAAARRVKLWSLNTNLFLKESHQMTTFTLTGPLKQYLAENISLQRLIEIFLGLQTLWPYLLTKPDFFRFRLFFRACSLQNEDITNSSSYSGKSLRKNQCWKIFTRTSLKETGQPYEVIKFRCCARNFKIDNRRLWSVSLMWLSAILVYWNKRSYLHKIPTWLPFLCFWTTTWPPWRHVKTLLIIKTICLESKYHIMLSNFTWNKTVFFSNYDQISFWVKASFDRHVLCLFLS